MGYISFIEDVITGSILGVVILNNEDFYYYENEEALLNFYISLLEDGEEGNRNFTSHAVNYTYPEEMFLFQNLK